MSMGDLVATIGAIVSIFPALEIYNSYGVLAGIGTYFVSFYVIYIFFLILDIWIHSLFKQDKK